MVRLEETAGSVPDVFSAKVADVRLPGQGLNFCSNGVALNSVTALRSFLEI